MVTDLVKWIQKHSMYMYKNISLCTVYCDKICLGLGTLKTNILDVIMLNDRQYACINFYLECNFYQYQFEMETTIKENKTLHTSVGNKLHRNSVILSLSVKGI